LAVGYWRLVIGDWCLAVGGWWLAVGGWLLAVGNANACLILYHINFRKLSRLNLQKLIPIPC